MPDRYFVRVKLINTAPDFWRDASTHKKKLVIVAMVIIQIVCAVVLLAILSNQKKSLTIDDRRKVFAHYFMSMTKRYNESNLPNGEIDVFRWDIANATQVKLDGFILHVGKETWEPERVDQMYDAAAKFPGFQLFLNFDLSFPENKDANRIIQIFKRNLKNAAQFSINNTRPVLGVWEGEDVTFSSTNRTKGWTEHLIEPLKWQNISIYFMPYWPSSSEISEANSFIDGFQSSKAWPYGYDPVDYRSDERYIKDFHDANKKVISSVSPCYFSHSAKNNVVFRSEDTWHLRWEQLIKGDADFGQVISWNGFDESHAVGSINPYSSVGEYYWYKDMSNEAFTKMLPYYVEWFKTRKQPPLTENVVYFYHRPHSRLAPKASNDEIPKPETWKQAWDAFVIHSFIRDAGDYYATIFVNSRPMDGKDPFELKGGEINHIIVPFDQGIFGDIELVISQNNKELKRSTVSKLINPENLEKWNFNFDSRSVTF